MRAVHALPAVHARQPMHPAPPASRDGASAGLASSGAARAHGELRAELRGLKMRSLHKRGEELGIDDDALDNAEQKSEIVELIIQRLAGQQAAREDAGRGAALKMGPSAAAPAAADGDWEALPTALAAPTELWGGPQAMEESEPWPWLMSAVGSESGTADVGLLADVDVDFDLGLQHGGNGYGSEVSSSDVTDFNLGYSSESYGSEVSGSERGHHSDSDSSSSGYNSDYSSSGFDSNGLPTPPNLDESTNPAAGAPAAFGMVVTRGAAVGGRRGGVAAPVAPGFAGFGLPPEPCPPNATDGTGASHIWPALAPTLAPVYEARQAVPLSAPKIVSVIAPPKLQPGMQAMPPCESAPTSIALQATPSDNVAELCPFCLGGDSASEHRRDEALGGGGTRLRRQRGAPRRSIKMGQWWQSFGYDGPRYCQRCSELFRDHLIRELSNSANCSRGNECSDCAHIVAHFKNHDEVWSKVDARKEANELKRKNREASGPAQPKKARKSTPQSKSKTNGKVATAALAMVAVIVIAMNFRSQRSAASLSSDDERSAVHPVTDCKTCMFGTCSTDRLGECEEFRGPTQPRAAQSPDGTPPPRVDPATWSDKTGRMWMFGGSKRPADECSDCDDEHLSDMWELVRDGDMAWQRQMPATEDAAWPAKRAGAMNWHASFTSHTQPATVSFMFGGERAGVPGMSDLWSFDGSEWKSHCPQSRSDITDFLHRIHIPVDPEWMDPSPLSEKLPAHVCVDSTAWQAAIPQPSDATYDFSGLSAEKRAFEMWSVDQVPTSRWPLPRSFGTVTVVPSPTGDNGAHAFLFGGTTGAVDSNGRALGAPQPMNDLWHFRFHKNDVETSVTIGRHIGRRLGAGGLGDRVPEVEWTYVGPTVNYLGDDGVGGVGEYVTNHGYGSTSEEALWPGARSGHAAFAGPDGQVFIFGGVGVHLGRSFLQPGLGGADPLRGRLRVDMRETSRCSLLSELWVLVPVHSTYTDGPPTTCDIDLAPSCQPKPAYGPGIQVAAPGGIGDLGVRAKLKQVSSPKYTSPWSGLAPWTPAMPNSELEAVDPEHPRVIVPAYAQNQLSGFEHSRWVIVGGNLPGTAGPNDGRLGSWVSTPSWMTPRHSMISWTDGHVAFVLGGQSVSVEQQTQLSIALDARTRAHEAGCNGLSAGGCFIANSHEVAASFTEVSCRAGGMSSMNGTSVALSDMWSFSLDGQAPARLGPGPETNSEAGDGTYSLVVPKRLGRLPGLPNVGRAHAAFWQRTDSVPTTFWSGAGMSAPPPQPDPSGTWDDRGLDSAVLTGWSWDRGEDAAAMGIVQQHGDGSNAGGWRWDPECHCGGDGVTLPTYDTDSATGFTCLPMAGENVARGTGCGICQDACSACGATDYVACSASWQGQDHSRNCADDEGKPAPCAADACAIHACDVCRACTCPEGDDSACQASNREPGRRQLASDALVLKPHQAAMIQVAPPHQALVAASTDWRLLDTLWTLDD